MVKNKDLLKETTLFDINDDLFISDIAYYIKKYCGYETENSEINERRSNQFNLVEKHIKYFFDNYFKISSKRECDFNNSDYSKAFYYLSRTYPYCLFENGQIETKDLESAIYFYAINNLGANERDLENLMPLLKCINMKHINNYSSDDYNTNTVFTCYSEINGTTNLKYQRDTLYETVSALNDIDLISLLNEIVVMDGMENPRNILRGADILLLKNGIYYNVIEGTHKLLLTKILFELSYLISMNCFNNNTIFYAKTLIKK